MMEMECRVFVVVLLYFVQVSRTTQICTAVDKLSNTQPGIKLKDKSFLIQIKTSYMFCAKLCGLHRLCQSFNWNHYQDFCELNYDNGGSFMTHNQFIFTNVTGWPNVIKDACSNHDCPINTRCEAMSSAGFTCVVIGCSGAPQVNNVNRTSFSAVRLWDFDDMVLYPCNQDYHPSVNVTCTSNGTWLNFECFQIMSCMQVFTCNGNVEDGEYWIRSHSFNDMIKLYCEFKPNSKKEFITLNEYNMASKPFWTRNNDSCNLLDVKPYNQLTGYTEFQKVRIILNQKRIAINEATYSNTTLVFQNYGNAGDCINHGIDCGVIGKFIVDLGGTSFRVSTSTIWHGKEQNARIKSILFSNNDTRVVGRCGGNCGGCRPQNNRLYVESNPHFHAPDTSAQHVLCPFSITF